MGKLLRNNTNNLFEDFWLLALRLCMAGFMLVHGLPKLIMLFSGNISFYNPIGIGELPSLILAVIAEVVCSVFIALGLYTRMAASILIVNMAVAAFIVHAHHAFGQKELAFLYMFGYITLLIFGGGNLSLNKLIRHKY